MEAENFSSDLDDYYVVLRCSNRKNESCFSRLKEFLLSVIARLMFRIRKRFSKIVINGKPLCKEPEDLPPDIRRLSYKQLKKIKEVLAKLDSGVQNNGESRPGYLAPPSTPRSGDDEIEIELIYTGEKLPEKKESATCMSESYTESSDVHVQLESEDIERDVNEGNKLNRKPRPKAAKGKRTETAIPPCANIDEEAFMTSKSLKRKRPKAAKGKRTACVEHPIDLPAEVLVESFKSRAESYRAKTRQRPMTPRSRYMEYVVTEEEDVESMIDEILNDIRCPVTKKPKKGQKSLKAIVETDIAEEEKEAIEEMDDEEEDDDIFNVPYLPKSQRKYANSKLVLYNMAFYINLLVNTIKFNIVSNNPEVL